jgi:hypothetical protein
MKKSHSEVLVISYDTTAEELQAYYDGGAKPKGVKGESFEEFLSRNKLPDCDCGLPQCVCAIARGHKEDCVFRFALTCGVAIACEEHDFEICPICDPCTCPPPVGVNGAKGSWAEPPPVGVDGAKGSGAE